VLLGDFSQAILGMRETLNITMLKERFADTGQLAFVAHIRADVGFAHPESFVKLIGVKS
jgi:HK97 family phage major capsid protein